MKNCQCEFCGRVLGEDGLWTWDDSVKVDVMGFCGLCGKNRSDAAKKKYARDAKAVARRAARPHTVEPMTEKDWDVFRDGE